MNILNYRSYNNLDLGANKSGSQGQGNAKKRLKRKDRYLILAIIPIIVFLLFMRHISDVNPNASYRIESDKVFFGNRELVGVDLKHITHINHRIIKDSDHVYLNGKVEEGIDSKSFEALGKNIFRDNKGLYQLKSYLFKPGKLIPLSGTYDKASFALVDGVSNEYYRDKNNLYKLNINILLSNQYLTKIILDSLDISTFKQLDLNWCKDKNKIYFDNHYKLSVCPEIDTESFAILSSKIAKDKNQVYYISRKLMSDNNSATNEYGYAILENADPNSFKMINVNEYIDKDSSWYIDYRFREDAHAY